LYGWSENLNANILIPIW